MAHGPPDSMCGLSAINVPREILVFLKPKMVLCFFESLDLRFLGKSAQINSAFGLSIEEL